MASVPPSPRTSFPLLRPAAKALGVPERTLYRILRGRSFGPNHAEVIAGYRCFIEKFLDDHGIVATPAGAAPPTSFTAPRKPRALSKQHPTQT